MSNFICIEVFHKLSFSMYVISTYSYLTSKCFCGGLTVALCMEGLAVCTVSVTTDSSSVCKSPDV